MGLGDDLRAVLGVDRVLEEPLELHLYSRDASLIRGAAACVVFPETTAEVVEVVKVASAHESPLVVRGAGTGLTGGAAPIDGGVVLVTTRMTELEIDSANGTAWVGPGVVNLELSRRAAPFGLHFAPDPSSQSACTIGGNVANNSGGPHCLAEGSTTSHVLALELVLADGETVVLGSDIPDPPGLDLRGVVVGSEGTTGVVTRAQVRLVPLPPEARTLLIDFPSVEGAAATVSGTIAAGVVPAALEIMDQRMTEAVENWLHAGLPVDAAAILLAEVLGAAPAVEAEAALIEEIAFRCGARRVRLAVDEAERETLWKARKSAFGAVAQAAPDYYLHDTVVPRTRLVETMTGVYEIADRYGITLLNVYHAGDGNLHPLIAFDAAAPGVAELVRSAGDEIVALCVANGGALSGEHGIGLEKRDLMHLVFDEPSLDAQARIRDVFDPGGSFNPSKVLPKGARCFDLEVKPPAGAWI